MDLDTQSGPLDALAQIQSQAPHSLQEDLAKLRQLYERRSDLFAELTTAFKALKPGLFAQAMASVNSQALATSFGSSKRLHPP